ncbi:MAG: hypothetical protein GY883_05535 [Shimia sp.]|nr:hypothetical protein [Shimia sp.]
MTIETEIADHERGYTAEADSADVVIGRNAMAASFEFMRGVAKGRFGFNRFLPVRMAGMVKIAVLPKFLVLRARGNAA